MLLGWGVSSCSCENWAGEVYSQSVHAGSRRAISGGLGWRSNGLSKWQATRHGCTGGFVDLDGALGKNQPSRALWRFQAKKIRCRRLHSRDSRGETDRQKAPNFRKAFLGRPLLHYGARIRFGSAPRGRIAGLVVRTVVGTGSIATLNTYFWPGESVSLS